MTQENQAPVAEAVESAGLIASIPMPAKRTPVFAARGSKYDLTALRPGTDDCLVLDAEDAAGVKKAQSKLSSAVSNYKRSHPDTKFSIRSFEVDGQHKVGVWRIA